MLVLPTLLTEPGQCLAYSSQPSAWLGYNFSKSVIFQEKGIQTVGSYPHYKRFEVHLLPLSALVPVLLISSHPFIIGHAYHELDTNFLS